MLVVALVEVDDDDVVVVTVVDEVMTIPVVVKFTFGVVVKMG